MKRNNLWLILLFVCLSIPAVAQKKPVKKPAVKKAPAEKPVEQKHDVATDEKKVRDIIAFLEFMLNTLGGRDTPARDKDVLITESYSKIFRDSKVQVEDDLDEERSVITYKDVVAYLKDVNFFFKNVRFEFTIDNIKGSTLPNGQFYYKVTTTRNLTGTTAEGQSINNSQPRFIEINYNPKDQDLKIVSIYTKEFDEKRALTTWWNSLSYEWRTIFRRKLNLADSVNLQDIKRITAIADLDISNNAYIQSIDPLTQLINLHSLNLSGTTIADIDPIRNLTELAELSIANTKVKDLTPLKYVTGLTKLNIHGTDIADIVVIERMAGLTFLDLSNTNITDLTSLASLSELTNLNLSGTRIVDVTPLMSLVNIIDLNLSQTSIQDIKPLIELENLKVLDIDSTRVRDISALGNAQNLTILHANYTLIADLNALQKLPHLEKIYCDKTPIKQQQAESFMAANPKALVIFDSEDLKTWWSTLSPSWKTNLIKTTRVGTSPTKEELAKLTLLDSLNLRDTNIDDLEPVRKFQRLKKLSVSKTRISDLSALQELRDLKYLDISETSVSNLSGLTHLKKLEVLKADNTKIENIDLISLPSLKEFYADGTSVQDITATAFLEKNPNCLLVYKTPILNQWWNQLSPVWTDVFREVIGKKTTLTTKDLHELVEKESLEFKDSPVSDLSALREFIQLKELHFSGTAITNIAPVDRIRSLKSLHATHSPIQKIESISSLANLEELDISNTPIEDVYELWKLKKLKKLNCSGTQLKRLDALEKMESLEYLDCSNTNVSRLTSLDYLPLKTLKCYNTKVSTRAIENFKASHPDCNVMYYR